MTPEHVYASLLRALGVPGDEVPVTEAEQATASHPLMARLAAERAPVLVVLDNAGTASQVIPLLAADTAMAGHPRRTHRPVPGG